MAAEIIDGRRRIRVPFQGRGVPGILGSLRTEFQAVEKVEQEEQLRGAGDERGDGHEFVHGLQVREETDGRSVRVTANAARDPDEMHRHEDAVGADEREPEMNFAQRLVHHAAKHFREPEISGGENSEDSGDAHHQVEVRDHVVGGVQHVIHRRLREKQTRKTAGNEQRNKAEREKHRRLELNLCRPRECRAS